MDSWDGFLGVILIGFSEGIPEVAESLAQRTDDPFKLLLLCRDWAGRQSYPHTPFMTDPGHPF